MRASNKPPFLPSFLLDIHPDLVSPSDIVIKKNIYMIKNAIKLMMEYKIQNNLVQLKHNITRSLYMITHLDVFDTVGK